jgi:hypothetical protein
LQIADDGRLTSAFSGGAAYESVQRPTFSEGIILWAVRWYCKYGISYRELQERLAERGVNIDHTTLYRWLQRYAPEMEKRLRWYWRNPPDLRPHPVPHWRDVRKDEWPVGLPVSCRRQQRPDR